MNGEQAPLIKIVEEIKLGNERRVTEVPEEIKRDLSKRAFDLTTIESASNSAF